MSRLCSPSVPAVCTFACSQGDRFLVRLDRALALCDCESCGFSGCWCWSVSLGRCGFVLLMGHPPGSLRSAIFAVREVCDF